MISLLQGKVVSLNDNKVVLMTAGGVGYQLHLSPAARELCQTTHAAVTLETFLVVREDAQELFGFADSQEKQLFLYFITVSGVGPRSALHLFSLGTVEEISGAIVRGDIEYLTKVSGIGKKIAERIVVELKSKLEERGIPGEDLMARAAGGTLGDAVAGLIALGYSHSEAREAVKKLVTAGKTSEQLLKEALQLIG